MALCVEVVGGVLQVVSPQPAVTSACAMVVMSGAEAASSPWSFSVEDAQAIAWAVVSLWLVAAGWRLLIRAARELSAGGESDA